MANIRYSQEKLGDIPIPEDGVSFSNISANGITPYLKIGSSIYSANYGYETVTISLKGIQTPPYNKPTPKTMGTESFSFRNRNWKVIDVQEGSKFNIAGETRFSSWSVTGVDTSKPILKI